MLFRCLSYVVLCALAALAHGDENKPIEVPYINFQPTIDGVLDSELSTLKRYRFDQFYRFDNPITEKVPVSYLLAYNATHLYLYIEAESEQVSYNRRGYLYGDGYKLLLGLPQSDGLTNEYYDLFFSPSQDPNYFERQRIGTYNFKNVSRAFSQSSQSQEKSVNGKSGFEALIAWSDVHPIHPWFSKAIGYNLYFAKYIAEENTNGYAVVHDEGIWDEEVPRRNYTGLTFAQPSIESAHTVIQFNKRNLKYKESLPVDVFPGADSADLKIMMMIKDDQGKIVSVKSVPLKHLQQMSASTIQIPFALDPGRYQLEVQQSDQHQQSVELVIFPEINFNAMHKIIGENRNQLSAGLQNTLLFKLQQIEQKLSQLHAYESGVDIWDMLGQYEKEYQQFKQGVDPYAHRVEPYRRAFRSEQDQTLQPYTIRLPENYDADKKYPLLVFLHGSGQDEQNLLNRQRGNGRFIELAPLGRDLFRAYSAPASQRDIIEAIEDVKKHFSVDADQIVVGGFSMGGYGALRAFYEHPDLYQGVAVFAGHPDLANAWLDGDFPNFLEQHYLESFKGKPVFVYHGTKDAAIHVSLAEKLITQLKAAGAEVSAHIVEGRGHTYQDEATHQKYMAWLEATIE